MTDPSGRWATGPAGIRLDTFSRRAFVGSEELHLTRICFDILAVMLANLDSVVETPALVRSVWGYEERERLGFAYTAVYRLRKELGRAGADDVVESVRGVGFRVRAPQGGEGFDAGQSVGPDARRTLEACSTAIMTLDPDRRILWANPAAERLTGYALEDLRRLPSTAALTPQRDHPRRNQSWREVQRGSAMWSDAVEIIRRDGSVVAVSGCWKPVSDEAGRFAHAVVELWPAVPDDDAPPAVPTPIRRVARSEASPSR